MKTTLNMKTIITSINAKTSSEVLRDYKNFVVESSNFVNIIKSCYVARYNKLNTVTSQQLGEAFGMSKANACKMNKVGTYVLDNLDAFMKMASKDYVSYRNLYDSLVYNVNIFEFKSNKAFSEALKEAKKARKGEALEGKKEDKGNSKGNSKGKDKKRNSNKTLKVQDLEKMNSAQLYTAIVELYNAIQSDNDKELQLQQFVDTIDKLRK